MDEIKKQTPLEIRLAEIRNKREYYDSGDPANDDEIMGYIDREYTDICDEEIRINVFLWLEAKLLLRRQVRLQTQVAISLYIYPDIFTIISSYI
jgi:hypothetical protein